MFKPGFVLRSLAHYLAVEMSAKYQFWALTQKLSRAPKATGPSAEPPGAHASPYFGGLVSALSLPRSSGASVWAGRWVGLTVATPLESMVTELPLGGSLGCRPGAPEVGPAPEVAGSWRSGELCGGALCCDHANPAESESNPIAMNDRRA
jgi:hypothetical protein